MTDPTILALAAEYAKTPAQVLLSWAVQRGTSVVPKSATPGRIRENMEVFELGEGDMERVDKIWEGLPEVEGGNGQGRRANDPRVHVGFDIFDEVVDEPVGED